jgi:phycocyanobilin:ferredoxin oxidoreductase
LSSPFAFAALTLASEDYLVRELGLEPLSLPPGFGRAEGEWRGAEATIETRAYRGGAIRYARFVVLRGADLEIGNVLCLPAPVQPLPILGADLVALGRETGMLAADLSPVLPAGPERAAQLAPLAARRAQHPPLPPGGRLPDWCAAWFSPCALYTRVEPSGLGAAVDAFRDFPRAFVELARYSLPRPALASEITAAQDGYAAAHRTDDKGLRLLATMFGTAWAERYVGEVLFPPSEMLPGQRPVNPGDEPTGEVRFPPSEVLPC